MTEAHSEDNAAVGCNFLDMATVDESLALVVEARVTLMNLAYSLRTGQDPELVAAQADADATTLELALAALRA